MNEPEIRATPLEAYKLARLALDDGTVRFAPLNHRSGVHATYENPGTAVCAEGHHHDAPAKECSCGFYAVADREELWRLGWQTFETPTLRVLLYGRIVEHRHGYRAARQHVELAELAGRCWWCGEQAELLGRRTRRQRYLAASCRRCAKYDPISADAASADLGCEVTFVDVDDEKASRRTERAILALQTLPSFTFSLAAILVAILTGVGEIAGVGGLLAAGWLVPGRALAERAADRAGLSAREKNRVIARTGAVALIASVAGWGASSIVAVAYAPTSMALTSTLLAR
ncbi:MAG: hypothetical protein KJS90_08110 [Acidobacteria bacterium]|nr:hypothetical protein [Acidobacteriota bacterium]